MTATGLVIQNPSTWGLASISSRTPGASGYVFDNAGTHATFSYVLDTGIRLTHQDFGGRALFGANYAGDADNDDANGHGTHVAAIIGGQTYGVAKKTTLIAVKVLRKDGGGANSAILAGINYVVSAAASKAQSGAAVINMSLTGAPSSALDNAVANAVSAGIPVVVAAGNENRTASSYSPARAPSAICVASIQSDDVRSGFSNWGADVDIFAPGSSIVSAYIGSDMATAALSGTSMAAPHVAGLVSYFRGLEGPSSSAAVRARLLGYAVVGRVKDAQGAPSLVAYNGNGGR
jgi:oryzin